MKIGIIGAGIAGLASAVRMAARGYEVEVFEANTYPGGKLSEVQLGEYRFDAGPSLFTMPQYVEALFDIAQTDMEPYFSYEKIPVVCNYFWEDGTRLSAFAAVEDFAKEIQTKLGCDPNELRKAMKDSARKYDLSGKIFLEYSLHKISTWLTWDVLKAMMMSPLMDIFTTMNKVNKRHFSHPKMIQLFNRYATYNGSNPYKAPGILSIIPHFEHHIGAFIPKGGMHSITKAIFQLAKDKGVNFHFNSPVEEIIVKDKKASALKVNNKIKSFDTIICNMDIFYAYRKLMPTQKHPAKTLAQPKSTSALIFYWGIKSDFPELDLHNILFSENYKKEFDYLDSGRIYEDPTIYINITSKYNPSDAPEACQNWFTMINVPFDGGQDWDTLIAKARKNILDKVSRILGKDIESLIACEDILDPRSIDSKTSSHLGALYGTSSNNRMAAFQRHPNFSRKIKNLYFCGGSVHPGGGIPLSLLSAKIIDDLMPKN